MNVSQIARLLLLVVSIVIVETAPVKAEARTLTPSFGLRLGHSKFMLPINRTLLAENFGDPNRLENDETPFSPKPQEPLKERVETSVARKYTARSHMGNKLDEDKPRTAFRLKDTPNLFKEHPGQIESWGLPMGGSESPRNIPLDENNHMHGGLRAKYIPYKGYTERKGKMASMYPQVQI
ncbi:hypothetical protein CFIO01_06214 [Colletotrichum fioriniae PJ7]|uniref:Uncharacterized protein n=1 Tax=Colletotrichum fioriniae PJ7 TaxID=1445577 RepID=A0A010QSC3_9PEZI|nr:hypothetical protein CFIO01_06214 [Colletotrichum fioriniae PJ7]